MSDKSIFTAPLSNHASSVTAALLIGTVLVGCTAPGSGPGASRYEPTYLRLTEERQFAQALRQHYLELATNAFDRGDVTRSDFYSLRALMAAEGKLAQPGQVARHIGAGAEATAAGQRLVAALSSGARTGSPDLAARAQAAYDCWLVESGPDGDPQIAQSCRYNAMNALAQLEGASTGARLVTSGGPVQPQGETYVVESGAQSQTINAAGGYTIQIITETVTPAAQQYYAPVAAQYTTVEHATQSYAAPAPSYIESVPAPQAMPMQSYVETAPMMQEEVVTFVAPQNSLGYEPGYEPMAMAAPEPMPMMQEAAPEIYDPAPMYAPIDTGPAYYDPAPIEVAPAAATYAPVEAAPTYSYGAIETVPVFDTRPVQSMPAIEMTALPMNDSSAANALINATANMGGEFSIFFGFDSDEITLEGEDVLIDAVEKIQLSGASRVTLMGFTDSVGDARYNQLLAMRRSQSVRKFLQSKLDNSITFEILPVGEVQAVKNGGDGVKEALNRKVEIGLR